MMKTIILYISIFFISPLAAQLKSPLKPVGYIAAPKTFKEKTHNFFLSKKFKLAIEQRDSFYFLFYNLEKQYNQDTTQRGIDYRQLQNEFSNLSDEHNLLRTNFAKLNSDYKLISDKFSEFIESSTSKQEKLDIALQQKNKELLEREKKLKELEAITLKQDSISRALKELIRNALLGFNSQDLTVELKNGKVYISFSDEFLFKSGKADVEGAGLEALKKVSEIINTNPKVDILIEGHTDNVPMKSAKYQDNWELSAGRALSVVKILSQSYGVNPLRLSAAGRGEFVPKVSNDTPAGKAKNRRVEIILIPDLSELYKIIYK